MGKDNSYYIALHNKPAVVVVAAAVVAFVVDSNSFGSIEYITLVVLSVPRHIL